MAENTEIIERINFYVQQKGGNKSALARDWGVHPSHLTVVLKGTRNVSPTMLMNAVKNERTDKPSRKDPVAALLIRNQYCN